MVAPFAGKYILLRSAISGHLQPEVMDGLLLRMMGASRHPTDIISIEKRQGTASLPRTNKAHKPRGESESGPSVLKRICPMPVNRRPAAPISVPAPAPANSSYFDRKTPFASVAEASAYLKESKRTVRELVARGVFKLAPNSNGKEKPWRLLWSEIEALAAEQMKKAA